MRDGAAGNGTTREHPAPVSPAKSAAPMTHIGTTHAAAATADIARTAIRWLVALVLVEYVPAGHCVAAAFAVPEQKVPAGQGVQADVAAPPAEKVPARQNVQAAAAAASAKVPAGQVVQADALTAATLPAEACTATARMWAASARPSSDILCYKQTTAVTRS